MGSLLSEWPYDFDLGLCLYGAEVFYNCALAAWAALFLISLLDKLGTFRPMKRKTARLVNNLLPLFISYQMKLFQWSLHNRG